MTQRIQEELALESVSTQSLVIAAFGSKRAQAKPCDIVRVMITTKSGPDLRLDLFVVPHICDVLTGQPASVHFRRYAHLSHLEFADEGVSNVPLEIDMLIGSDAY